MENNKTDTQKDFLEIVKADFEARCKKLPSYSLRSYAQFLGVSPATMSLYFAKKIELSPKIFSIISTKLELSPEVLSHYREIVVDNKQKKLLVNYNNEGHSELEMDEFSFISDWYHYAILEIFSLKNHKDDPEWIAEKLGIADVEKVKSAIERLIKLNLLQRNTDGKMENVDRFTSILDYNHSSSAMRERQKQILCLSKEKIDVVAIADRDHSGLTMAIDSKLMPEIKDKIKKFRRSLGNFIGKNSTTRDAVYEIQISFFPLTDTVTE